MVLIKLIFKCLLSSFPFSIIFSSILLKYSNLFVNKRVLHYHKYCSNTTISLFPPTHHLLPSIIVPKTICNLICRPFLRFYCRYSFVIAYVCLVIFYMWKKISMCPWKKISMCPWKKISMCPSPSNWFDLPCYLLIPSIW